METATVQLAIAFNSHKTQHVLADNIVADCNFCRLEETMMRFSDPQQRALLWDAYCELSESAIELAEVVK